MSPLGGSKEGLPPLVRVMLQGNRDEQQVVRHA